MVNSSNHIHLKQFLERNKRQNFKRFFQKIKKILTDFSKKVKKNVLPLYIFMLMILQQQQQQQKDLNITFKDYIFFINCS